MGLLLLAGHSFPRAAAGPSVGAGALSANGKAHAMATATKATNVLQALQGHSFLPAQVTFNGVFLHGIPELLKISVLEIFDPDVRAHTGFGQNGLRAGETNSVDIGEGHFNPLVAGNVNAGDPCHGCSIEKDRCLRGPGGEDVKNSWGSALTLFVLGVGANDHDLAVATDHPA